MGVVLAFLLATRVHQNSFAELLLISTCLEGRKGPKIGPKAPMAAPSVSLRLALLLAFLAADAVNHLRLLRHQIGVLAHPYPCRAAEVGVALLPQDPGSRAQQRTNSTAEGPGGAVFLQILWMGHPWWLVCSVLPGAVSTSSATSRGYQHC